MWTRQGQCTYPRGDAMGNKSKAVPPLSVPCTLCTVSTQENILDALCLD